MKHLAFALLFCLFGTAAQAQGCGQTNPNCIVPDVQLCSTSNEQAANTKFTQCAIAAGIAANGAITALTGDGTATGPGSVPFTLATVNGNVGTFGSATQCVTVTTNGKGLITAVSAATCTPAAANVTGLGPAATAAAGQIPGTATNDNASAGNIGQIIESTVVSGSAVPLTSPNPSDVTSINLTAGDWEVCASLFFSLGGGTVFTRDFGWINTVSATDPNPPNGGAYFDNIPQIAAGVSFGSPVGCRRYSFSVTTTVYLTAAMTFAVSTSAAFGYIGARRAR